MCVLSSPLIARSELGMNEKSVAELSRADYLVVFDARVDDLVTLRAALLPSRIQSVVVAADEDGLLTITQTLAQTGARHLAIVSHGEPGRIYLGLEPIDLDTLQAQERLFQEWCVEEIALYVCEAGVDVPFVTQLGVLTGARVSASQQKVGSAALGGSWQLDGQMNMPFAPNALVDYAGVLATFTGSTGDDEANGITGLISGFSGGDPAELQDAIGDVFIAGAGNDTVIGGSGNDQVFGEIGNDSLVGGGGNDFIEGGVDNDTIVGGDGNDELYGQDGNDSLAGGSGNDLVIDRDGNDTFDGGIGEDLYWMQLAGVTTNIVFTADRLQNVETARIVTGSGNDDINISSVLGSSVWGNTSVAAGAGNDTVVGSSGNDQLFGEAGNDSLVGGGGNDFIEGGVDNDTIIGGDGNDELYGQDGNDSLAGGGGDDIVIDRDGGDTVDGGTGEDLYWLQLSGATTNIVFSADRLQNVEKAIINTGSGNDNINISSAPGSSVWGNSSVAAGAGNDTAIGSSGNDQLFGEGGDDYLVGGDGNDFIEGGIGSDALVGIDSVSADTLLGGAGDDVYYIDTGDVVIEVANEGTDTVYANGNFTLTANVEHLILQASATNGTGNDLGNYIAANTTLGVTISGLAGNDSLVGGTDNDSLIGGADNDSIEGKSGSDTIEGGTGNDTLYGGGDNDTLLGGTETDYLFGEAGSDFLNGDAGNDILYGGTENDTLLGGDDNDYLSGDAGLDSLVGGAGNDALYGIDGVGADTLLGGTGDDVYYLDAGDLIVEVADEGTDTVYANGSFTLTANAENLILQASATNGTGNDLGNYIAANTTLGVTISGLAGNDSLVGGSGNDSLLGGADNDSIEAKQGNDTLEGGAGNDTLYGGGDNDTLLGGTEDDYLFGDAGTDSLDGGNGNDFLFGGAENDTLLGGAGNDYLVGDTGTAFLDGGTGNDTLFGESGNDTLLGGTENDYLFGEAGADSLNGGAGNDILLGGDGNDSLVGGAGDDIYSISSNGDIVTEVANEGEDLVYASSNYTLTAHVEHLILQGTATNGTGNDLSNFILGNSTLVGTLVGLAGNDSLYGGAANDTLIGGAGDDLLAGGDGIDQFLFGDSGVVFNTLGIDTISGFVGDQLVLSQSTFTGLSTGSSLSAADFATVTTDADAATSTGLIVYNSNNGNLFYNQDRDTSGFGSGGQFASLTGNPGLAASNFTVVA
jgi:Ca2+-binding RTX toxin-like protein